MEFHRLADEPHVVTPPSVSARSDPLRLRLARLEGDAERFMASLPLAEGGDREGVRPPPLRPATCPLWIRLPVGLHDAWSEESKGAGDAAVDEDVLSRILWSQYALFLHVRLLDDLLDGHETDLRLVFVADRLLVDALGTVDGIEGLDASFRAFVLERLRRTVDGILEVQSASADPGRFRRENLELHARVNSLFEIATAGVCTLHGRPGAMSWLSELLTRAAVSDQICDDLQDFLQDLEDGRFTWAGNVLLGAGPRSTVDEDSLKERARDGIVDPDRAEPILAELDRMAREGRDALPEDPPGIAVELVEDMERRPEEVERILHEIRVWTVLGNSDFLPRVKQLARSR